MRLRYASHLLLHPVKIPSILNPAWPRPRRRRAAVRIRIDHSSHLPLYPVRSPQPKAAFTIRRPRRRCTGCMGIRFPQLSNHFQISILKPFPWTFNPKGFSTFRILGKYFETFQSKRIFLINANSFLSERVRGNQIYFSTIKRFPLLIPTIRKQTPFSSF